MNERTPHQGHLTERERGLRAVGLGVAVGLVLSLLSRLRHRGRGS